MKILYFTKAPSIHELPIWLYYHDNFPEDEIKYVCVLDKHTIDKYTSFVQSDIIIYSLDYSQDELRTLVDNADFIFWKTTKQDSRIPPLLKEKTNIFRLSENLIKINSRGLLNHLYRFYRFLKLIFISNPYENLNKKTTHFLCQSYNLNFELKLIRQIKRKNVLKFGYFNNYKYCDYESFKNRSNIVCITTDVKAKNNDQFFFFLKQVHKYSNYTVDVYGNLPEKNSFNSKGLSYASNFVFKGFAKNNDLQNDLSTYDIMFFPSKKAEGFGVAVIEAMAAGIIVFCHKDAGCAKFVIKDGENGFIYSSHFDLKRKIKKYFSMKPNKVELLRKNAINTIKEQWDCKIVANRLHEYLHSIKEEKEIIFEDGPLSHFK